MFTTDSRAENFLTSLGVRYTYKNGLRLPDDFAPGWNTENIGRPVAVRDDAVIEYAALMEAGSAAPAPILCDAPEGFRVLDGVQRLSAAVLQNTTRVSAYVVDTDDANSLLTIRVMANPKMQGRAEPIEWSKKRAVEMLVVQQGMTAEQVASIGGWKVVDVRRIAEACAVQKKITSSGGPEMTEAMLLEFDKYSLFVDAIKKAPVPVVGFLQTLKKSKISVADAVPYISTFFSGFPKSEKLHTVYSERLNAVHDDPEMQVRLTGRQGAEMPKDVVLLKNLKAAETTLDHIMTHGDTVLNVDEYFQIINRITRKLKELKELTTSKK
jgi:hypothetical protein